VQEGFLRAFRTSTPCRTPRASPRGSWRSCGTRRGGSTRSAARSDGGAPERAVPGEDIDAADFGSTSGAAWRRSPRIPGRRSSSTTTRDARSARSPGRSGSPGRERRSDPEGQGGPPRAALARARRLPPGHAPVDAGVAEEGADPRAPRHRHGPRLVGGPRPRGAPRARRPAEPADVAMSAAAIAGTTIGSGTKAIGIGAAVAAVAAAITLALLLGLPGVAGSRPSRGAPAGHRRRRPRGRRGPGARRCERAGASRRGRSAPGGPGRIRLVVADPRARPSRAPRSGAARARSRGIRRSSRRPAPTERRSSPASPRGACRRHPGGGIRPRAARGDRPRRGLRGGPRGDRPHPACEIRGKVRDLEGNPVEGCAFTAYLESGQSAGPGPGGSA